MLVKKKEETKLVLVIRRNISIVAFGILNSQNIPKWERQTDYLKRV